MSVNRRDLLVGGAALAASLPFAARAQADRLTLAGSALQGGFMIGRAGAGAQAFVDETPLRLTEGVFCFGFGAFDEKPVAVRVVYADGKAESLSVAPGKRNFPVQGIDGLPDQYVNPDPQELARIARDAKTVTEARATDSGHLWFAEDFDWPADGPITGIYGSHRVLNGEPREAHYGVDIAAPAGTPIRAPIPGIVTLAEYLYLSGNTMILDHGHGVSTSYLHMSRMDAKVGDALERGQPLGLIGQTGRATGPHLCWRMNWFQTRLDVALVAPFRPNDRA